MLKLNQSPTIRIIPRDALAEQIREFLIDREARGLSKRTLQWYREQLPAFCKFLATNGVTDATDVTPSLLRSFLLALKEAGHNPGGVSNSYRAARAFLNWYASEDAPDGWKNPAAKVKLPKASDTPLEPVNLEDLRKILDTCERKTFCGDRDRAMLLFLLDTGCRRAELCALDAGDVNIQTGAVSIRHGKGNKPRTTFIGAKTKRALLAYLKHRQNLADAEPLWMNESGGRISYDGPRSMLRRRAARAGVPDPSLHSFRRGFALAALRNGCDLVSLQRLLGHADLSVVSRYLRQVEGDLQAAHAKVGPVDHML